MAIDEPRPYSKETQLARGERRYTRRVAGARRWQQIASAKQGPCRVCDRRPPCELHHLVSRGQGGSDTESNIVPLCRDCHRLVEGRDPGAGMTLARGLTDAEYAYAVQWYGEGFFERRLGIVYERA